MLMVPRAEGPFERIDALARMAFGLIWDRWQLSVITSRKQGGFALVLPEDIRERYNGRPVATYCVYTQADLAREMGVTERTARRCVADLRVAGLVDVHRRAALGASCYTIPRAVVEYLPHQYIRDKLGQH